MSGKRKINASRRRSQVTLLLAVAILVPSLWGFGSKFVEFLLVYQGDPEGAFAITPILNYLLASLGFLFLLFWAIAHGMFHDIERPKYALLEREKALDETTRPLQSSLAESDHLPGERTDSAQDMSFPHGPSSPG